MPKRKELPKKSSFLNKGTKENDRILINIGEKNVTNWKNLKEKLHFKYDWDFVEYLLSVADKCMSPKNVFENSKINPSGIEDNHINKLLTDVEPKILATLDDNVCKVNEKNSRELQIITEYDMKKNNTGAKSEVEPIIKQNNRKIHDFSSAGNVIKHTSEGTDNFNNHISSKSDSEISGIDKIQSGKRICQYCDGSHPCISCPLNYSSKFITDSISLENWKGGKGYAFASLPKDLELKDDKVFTLIQIPFNTRFGPLVGASIREVEIADDSNMEHTWELSEGKYVSTEDLNRSNWMRWVRPAPTRNQRNLVALSKDGSVYFIAVKLLDIGDELLYWAEPSSPWSSKNMEKTNCGGCNLKFKSAMGYRLHCSVFHDPTLSLTVRKYHCKVCAEPILGKQNIINHAVSAHGGRGAYQCQFCSKFFLRLNYLEMHRNYGCQSNPHRSRPLCHHCGRKFCQPQKLKVHIKRMHSDMPDTLREFQCTSCTKLLGSRAALQRHLKEVHKRPPGLPCPRCGKEFQNTSNLKIHMLTHSGVKPYRCKEDSCNSAFTTKQCLQFHYKKVHGLSECELPQIERSVDYTFDAYSGEQLTSDNSASSGQNAAEETVSFCNTETPIISKGSRKWMGGDLPKEEFRERLEVEPKVFPRNEGASASLLVEAAIESAEKDIGSTFFPYFSPTRYMGIDRSFSSDEAENLSKKHGTNCDSYVGGYIYQDYNSYYPATHYSTNYSLY